MFSRSRSDLRIVIFVFVCNDPRTGGRSRFLDDTRTWPPQRSWVLESGMGVTARRRSEVPREFSWRCWVLESGFALLSSV